jgi:hypothetical protein
VEGETQSDDFVRNQLSQKLKLLGNMPNCIKPNTFLFLNVQDPLTNLTKKKIGPKENAGHAHANIREETREPKLETKTPPSKKALVTF